MSATTYTDHVTVTPITHMGSDALIIAAAKVSTLGSDVVETLDNEAKIGFLNFLMKNRHGTPFEHNAMQFFVKAPIFVFREFHRHRIGFSYNEESGRYKELTGEFYIPGFDRPGLMQVPGAKAGQYSYADANPDQLAYLVDQLCQSYDSSYRTYENLLNTGYAKEVARMCLPVAIFSSMFVTCNARSLMSFLGLRTKRDKPEAMFPSKPQWEIELVAKELEGWFAQHYPLTYACWIENGRVAP